MTDPCADPLCPDAAEAGAPFCTRHWLLVPAELKENVLRGADQAMKGARWIVDAREGRVQKLWCPYCGAPSKMLPSSAIYPHRQEDFGWHWACLPCGAWVGTHKNSLRRAPLGRLANAELRELKRAVHEVFDPLWQAKMRRDGLPQHEARNAAYAWLAGQLGIEVGRCHVGMFDENQCRRAVDAIRAIPRRKAA